MRRHPDIRLLRRASGPAGSGAASIDYSVGIVELLVPGGRTVCDLPVAAGRETLNGWSISLRATRMHGPSNCQPCPVRDAARVYGCSPV